MLYGISGFAQAGKDTVCLIMQHHGIVSERYAFADPIKVICNRYMGWDERHAFGELKEVKANIDINELDDTGFLELCTHYGLDSFRLSATEILDALVLELLPYIDVDGGLLVISPRKVYQLFGTEVCRNWIDQDIWTKIAPSENVAIPDVRFPNEVKWIRENGGIIIRVVKDDVKPVEVHESESYIENLTYNIKFCNNGSLADLETQVMEAFDIPMNSPRLFSNSGEKIVSYAETFKDRVKSLENVTGIQLQHGNWDYDPYMHGYANGLILALAIMKGEDTANFRDAPAQWIRDVANSDVDGYTGQVSQYLAAMDGLEVASD